MPQRSAGLLRAGRQAEHDLRPPTPPRPAHARSGAPAWSTTSTCTSTGLDHPQDQEVSLVLIHNNVRRILSDGNGGTGDGYIDTFFDDDATPSITAGTAPFTGSFKPEEAFTPLLFGPMTGSWSLEFGDSANLEDDPNVGTIVRWGIVVSGPACVDPDGDLVYTANDNCPDLANLDQDNYDRFQDAAGDACDADDDSDSIPDTADACPRGVIGAAADYDTDGCKDTEDADDDNDGVADTADACPQASKGAGGDTDGDGCKDFEELDDDNDGVPDTADKCPLAADTTQTDTDADGAGDACDPDDDGDGVIDNADAFPLDPARSKVEPPPPPAAVVKVPTISKLKLSPTSFAAAKKGASISASSKKKPKVGTTITFTSDVDSATTFTVSQSTRGVTKGKKCVKPARGQKGKRCTLLVRRGTFAMAHRAGR